MLALMNWRLWALVGLLALGPIGYLKGRSDGQDLARAEIAHERLEANREAEKISAKRQSLADEAAKEAAKREAGIRRDASLARGQLDGLRGDLAALERASAQSLDAANKSVAALSSVFADCSRRYQELAEVADRHASDSLTLQRAWPQ